MRPLTSFSQARSRRDGDHLTGAGRPGIHRDAEVELGTEQLQALVLGLPWQRVGAGGAIALL